MGAVIEQFGCGCVGIRMRGGKVLKLFSCEDDEGFMVHITDRVVGRNLDPSVCKTLSPDEAASLCDNIGKLVCDGKSLATIKSLLK